MQSKLHLIISLFILISFSSYSQFTINSGLSGIKYEKPQEFEIGGITISGIKYLDHEVLIHLTGLRVGDKIMVPGEKLTKAVKFFQREQKFRDEIYSIIPL